MFKNISELATHVAAGNRVKYVFFWGEKNSSDQVSKACLSQWYAAPFIIENQMYATAEHFMMAEKALLFGESELAARIIKAESPGKAKALGREVLNFDQVKWDERKIEVVLRGNLQKFRQNPALKDFLISTGKRVLVEASPIDRVWGAGLAVDDPKIENPADWRGENLLGFALMFVREQLSAVA